MKINEICPISKYDNRYQKAYTFTPKIKLNAFLILMLRPFHPAPTPFPPLPFNPRRPRPARPRRTLFLQPCIVCACLFSNITATNPFGRHTQKKQKKTSCIDLDPALVGRMPLRCEYNKERKHMYIVRCCRSDYCNNDRTLRLETQNRGTGLPVTTYILPMI